MYRNALIILTLSLVAAATASAAGLTFTTDPTDGVLTGTPGTTVGWGFTMTAPDSNYYALTGVEFCFGAQIPTCPSTPVGVFSDIASYVEGDIIGPDYTTNPYPETYSPGISGLGEFAIDPSAAPQDLVGTLYVYYDEYAADPMLGGDAFLTGQVASSAAEVEIVSPTPEPSKVWMMLAAGLLIGVGRLREIRNVSRLPRNPLLGE